MVNILGLLIIIVGILIVLKSEWMLSNFGRIGFFDQHLGVEGGSRLGYKLMGFVIIFIGALMFTGLIEGFLNFVLGPFINMMSY